MLYAAIDIHKHAFQAAVFDPESGEVTEARFSADCESLARWAEEWRDRVSAVAIEATTGWRWVWRELVSVGFDVRLAEPVQTRSARPSPEREDRSARCALAGAAAGEGADPVTPNYVCAVWDRIESPNNNPLTPPQACANAPAFRGPAWFARSTDNGASWETAHPIFAPWAGGRRRSVTRSWCCLTGRSLTARLDGSPGQLRPPPDEAFVPCAACGRRVRGRSTRGFGRSRRPPIASMPASSSRSSRKTRTSTS